MYFSVAMCTLFLLLITNLILGILEPLKSSSSTYTFPRAIELLCKKKSLQFLLNLGHNQLAIFNRNLQWLNGKSLHLWKLLVSGSGFFKKLAKKTLPFLKKIFFYKDKEYLPQSNRWGQMLCAIQCWNSEVFLWDVSICGKKNLLMFNRINTYLTKEWREIEKPLTFQYAFC